MSGRTALSTFTTSVRPCSVRQSAIASSSRLPFYPSASRGYASEPELDAASQRTGRSTGKEAPLGKEKNGVLLDALKSLNMVQDPLRVPKDVGAGAIFSAPVIQRPRPTFKPNTLYHPGDLSKQAWNASPRPIPKPPLLGPSAPASKLSDPFHILSINPHDEVLNTNIMQAYISQMGKIKTRAETGLTWKNQRRMGKAVRRARSMGLISRWGSEL